MAREVRGERRDGPPMADNRRSNLPIAAQSLLQRLAAAGR
jgi:hypothetical protein